MRQFILQVPGHWSNKYTRRLYNDESIMKDYQVTVPRLLLALKKYDTAGNQATMLSGYDAIVRALQEFYQACEDLSWMVQVEEITHQSVKDFMKINQ